MAEHPIESLMTTAMQSIKEMVDVNTIVGEPVQAPDSSVIIPISKVAFGFAAGGGDYQPKTENDENEEGNKARKLPFAGGSGAGVSINPVAFMVVGQGSIRLVPVNVNSTIDRIIDLLPSLFDKVSEICDKKFKILKSDDEEE